MPEQTTESAEAIWRHGEEERLRETLRQCAAMLVRGDDPLVVAGVMAQEADFGSVD